LGGALLENSILIRPGTSADFDRIKEIADASFPWYFRYFAMHSVTSQDGKVLIAEIQGVIIGFAKLIEFNIGLDKYSCILWIAVHPSFRRKGIALSLTISGVKILKKEGAKAVFASTQRRNIAAKGALVKAGFRNMGFLDLWRLFGWRVFSFYREIWFAPGEIVLMLD
jgi:ribosomal protein S18 acetylase RimI-like enzyme